MALQFLLVLLQVLFTFPALGLTPPVAEWPLYEHILRISWSYLLVLDN